MSWYIKMFTMIVFLSEFFFGVWADSRLSNIKRSVREILLFEELKEEEEGNVLFNDALNTFYLRLYGVRHMVKDHSVSVKGNPLLSHGLLFPISSKRSFICIIPQTG